MPPMGGSGVDISLDVLLLDEQQSPERKLKNYSEGVRE